MNKQVLASALMAAMALAPVAHAGHKGKPTSFHDYAEVVDVEPVVRMVEVSTPRRQCWEEKVHHPARYGDYHSAAGEMIVGGVIGGVIGNQFGGGSGKDIATVAGTVIGASLGHDHAARRARSRYRGRVSYEHRCRTVSEYHTEERIKGYRVTYVYEGQTFTTRLPYDPGERLRVRVSVAPVR